MLRKYRNDTLAAILEVLDQPLGSRYRALDVAVDRTSTILLRCLKRLLRLFDFLCLRLGSLARTRRAVQLCLRRLQRRLGVLDIVLRLGSTRPRLCLGGYVFGLRSGLGIPIGFTTFRRAGVSDST